MICGTREMGRGMGCWVRGVKGGGVAGSAGSVALGGPFSSTGEVGREGPGKGERLASLRSVEVGREGALEGRNPGDGAGGSREVLRMGC